MTSSLQPPDAPLLIATAIRKTYASGGTLGRNKTTVHALAGVDLEVSRGTALAVVGESGAGKSTLARCIAGLEQPDSGEIWFGGSRVGGPHSLQAQEFHRQVQLVLQDSATALNPRFTAAEVVAEPLVVQRIGNERERKERVLSLFHDVGLTADLATRLPRQLSGGQRQRLAIARALSLEPRLLVLDEAFSGLDLCIQKQIALLLHQLRQRHGLTFIYISHDLALMAAIAGEIAIMYEGRIVERGPTAAVLRAPSHPHTQALVASMRELRRRKLPQGVTV